MWEFGKYPGIFYGILSVAHNTVMDLNNGMIEIFHGSQVYYKACGNSQEAVVTCFKKCISHKDPSWTNGYIVGHEFEFCEIFCHCFKRWVWVGHDFLSF